MAAFTSALEAVKRLVSSLLGGIAGIFKTQPSTPAMEQAAVQKPPGLDCPRCTFRIMISVPMLLSGEPVTCPSCGLRLTVDRQQSQACLDELKKVYDAVQKVEEVKGHHG
jgi:DNA-directed RNA polymerase subunit RPC12/RpoP